MKSNSAILLLLISGLPCVGLAQAATLASGAQVPSAQKPDKGGQKPAAAPPAASPVVAVSSSGPGGALQPALTGVLAALTATNMDKWKKGTVREEAADHIGVIQRDLQTTMPPLITAADAAPDAASAQLPLSRNLDAIYDVLLSVVEASRVSGPTAQVAVLDQALRGLNTARVVFDEHLQHTAEGNERQVSELQATVKAQSEVKCPEIVPAPATVCEAPVKKTPVHRKPKPPATITPGATPPATAAKPTT